MPPKRSALKLEQPAVASVDSDSSSDISLGSYRRSRQCCRSIKQSERNYSSLKLEALLSLIVGKSVRLSSSISSVRFDDDTGNGRVVRESLRIPNGALSPLSESLDELTALEGALLSRLQFIDRSIVVCSRRASLRPHRE